MKPTTYTQASETSETSIFLRFLRSALRWREGVGNVGNIYKFPTFRRPDAAPFFSGGM